MKHLPISILLLLSYLSHAQQTLVDCRDNKEYKTVEIDGTLWMAENLVFESELSSPTSEEQVEKQPNLKGRFYHVNEVDTICPCGWRLPDAEDWIAYFNFIANNHQIKLSVDKSHVAFMDYDSKINLFAENNPLNLVPTGRWEGNEYYLPGNFADFWTLDSPDYENSGKYSRPGVVHALPEVHRGKTHIHLRKDGFTNIHSHKHHLDPKKVKKLRKFMVRCVKNQFE